MSMRWNTYIQKELFYIELLMNVMGDTDLLGCLKIFNNE